MSAKLSIQLTLDLYRTAHDLKVLDGSVVKASVSGTCNVLSMISRSWVQTPVGWNLGCTLLLPKLYSYYFLQNSCSCSQNDTENVSVSTCR